MLTAQKLVSDVGGKPIPVSDSGCNCYLELHFDSAEEWNEFYKNYLTHLGDCLPEHKTGRKE